LSSASGSLKKVKIASLKRAKFNPSSRQRNVSTLTESIEKIGLLYPILVDKGNNVIDGHRRLSACEELEWDSVPVLVVEGDQAELFGAIGQSVRPLYGNETLHVYLKEPRAIGTRVRARIQSAEEVVGRKAIRDLAAGGLSISTWDVARRICRLSDQETPDMQKKVLNWLVKHKISGLVERALRGGADVAEIISAVNKDRPVKSKWGVVAQ
jgi:hypothetical protein